MGLHYKEEFRQGPNAGEGATQVLTYYRFEGSGGVR
jgi:hypothetical protein